MYDRLDFGNLPPFVSRIGLSLGGKNFLVTYLEGNTYDVMFSLDGDWILKS
jgi:hypothetical protein